MNGETVNNPRRIAIVGAGVSGILAIKACKEEEHLFSEIICYERTEFTGGLWMYREFEDEINFNSNKNNNNDFTDLDDIKSIPTCKSNVTTVMKGTIANSSKEMSSFSDFPPPPTSPNFMHHKEMLKYILSYAKHFDCLKHIKLNSEVINISKVGNKMSIELQVHTNEQSTTFNEIFDIVLIASGHHGRPYLPTFPGQSNFQGKFIYSNKSLTYHTKVLK